MKRTAHGELPQRRLQLASETLRMLTALDLTRAGGGDDAKNPTTKTAPSFQFECSVEDPSGCTVC